MLLPSPPSSASARRVLSARGCNRAPACPFTSRVQGSIIRFGTLSSQEPSPVLTSWDRVTGGYRNSPHAATLRFRSRPAHSSHRGPRRDNGTHTAPSQNSFRYAVPPPVITLPCVHATSLPVPVRWRPNVLPCCALPGPLITIAHVWPCSQRCRHFPPHSSISHLHSFLRPLPLFHLLQSTFVKKLLAQCFHRFVCVMSDDPLMNICSVGGNPVSAFLSWRLQATNACDVTLVWKSGYEHVAQYGISFK